LLGSVHGIDGYGANSDDDVVRTEIGIRVRSWANAERAAHGIKPGSTVGKRHREGMLVAMRLHGRVMFRFPKGGVLVEEVSSLRQEQSSLFL
jgi:hypothetical protein